VTNILVSFNWKSVLCQKFSQYLKVGGDSSALVRILEKIEGHLRENGTRFMSADSLARADCYLLPSLQHIRVAGKVWYCIYCFQWVRFSVETCRFIHGIHCVVS